MKAASFFSKDKDILVPYSDIPFIPVEAITRLRDAKSHDGINLLTVELDDSTGSY